MKKQVIAADAAATQNTIFFLHQRSIATVIPPLFTPPVIIHQFATVCKKILLSVSGRDNIKKKEAGVMNSLFFKRCLCLLLTLCLLPLTACGQKSESSVGDDTVSVVSTTATVLTTSAATTETTVVTTTATEQATTAIATATTTATMTTTTTTTVAPIITTTAAFAATTTTTSKLQKQWELYWSDEFEGDSLDSSKWNVESGTSSLAVKKADNVKVEDGNCVITVRSDDSTLDYEYSTAFVTTAHKFSFCYGRLEFRAKLPSGQGVWPALWTLGDNYLTIGDDTTAWPLCGEIDIMELVGSNGMRENQRIMATLHWGPDRDNHEQAHSAWYLPEPASEAYHIYAVEWDENEIVWFVDDIEYLRVSLDDPDMGDAFAANHWIIMSVDLYGYGDLQVNETTVLPQSMYVDYVRVYKEKT